MDLKHLMALNSFVSDALREVKATAVNVPQSPSRGPTKVARAAKPTKHVARAPKQTKAPASLAAPSARSSIADPENQPPKGKKQSGKAQDAIAEIAAKREARREAAARGSQVAAQVKQQKGDNPHWEFGRMVDEFRGPLQILKVGLSHSSPYNPFALLVPPSSPFVFEPGISSKTAPAASLR